MEIEKVWEDYFEASKNKFFINSDLKQFKSFVTESYLTEEILKFLPRLTSIIPSFDLGCASNLIGDFLDFSKNDIYSKLKEEPKKIFDFLKEDLDKRNINHIYLSLIHI